MLGRQRRDDARLARRKRADEHALHPRGERLLHLPGRAKAAPDLQADATPPRQALQQRGVLGTAHPVASRVEVDHVEPAGTRQRKAIRRLVRRLVEARDAAVVALQQAHDTSAGEVDGGDDLHCHDTMLT